MENKKRILIADASNEFRKLLCDTIGGEPDLEVVGATGDGQETVRLVREKIPEVLVMDMVLQNEDGLEVLRSLRDLEIRPKILILSGFVRSNVAELAAAEGADYYLMKPCKMTTLLERLRQMSAPCAGNEGDGAGAASGSRAWRVWSPPSSMRSGCRLTSRDISICGKRSSLQWRIWRSSMR